MIIPPRRGPTASRRAFLRLTGAAAATAGLAACSELSGDPEGTAAGEDELADLLPKYIEFTGGPEPDLPASEDGTVSAGFLRRPQNIIRAVEESPMTTGEEITAITPLWNPVPPGLPDNSYFAAVNERLGGTVRFNIADGNTYNERLSTTLASGDVPEMMQIPGWEIQGLSRFTEAANELFADLSPFIAGDLAEEYPLLANYPTAAWSYGVFGGTLLGIPWERVPYVNALFARQDILDELDLPHPTSAEELMEIAEEVNDPDSNRWAFASIDQIAQQVFGVPTLWRIEGGGLVHKFETEEMAQAIEFVTEAFEKGLVHPDYMADKDTDVKELIGSGQAVFYEDGFGAWHEMYGQYLSSVPEFRLAAIAPFAAEADDTPQIWRDEPAGMFTFIRGDLSEDRIRECLRVANWCSAPYGTEEWDLVWDGVEGEHFEINDGLPERTDLGEEEVANTYLFLSGRPETIFHFQYPGFVEAAHEWQTNAAQYLDEHPFIGIRVEQPSALSGENQPMEDAYHEIYRGQRQVSDWEGIVDRWRDDAGDAAREFYEEIAQEHGRL